MKVKSMKKALSLFCAGAMIATSFAVVNLDTVKAAGWNVETAEKDGKNYYKVPLNNLFVYADSYSTGEGANGHYDLLVDGNINTYYHSKYDDRGFGTTPVGNNNNTITVEFPQQVINGISYVGRVNGSNGRIRKVKIQREVAKGQWEDIKIAGATDTGKVEAALVNDANEQVVLFESAQKLDKIRLFVLESEGTNDQRKLITGGELSVLTPCEKASDGTFTVGSITATDPVTNETNRIAAPAPAGKVFAGWYAEEACTTPLALSAESSVAAYPKFVDANVLKTGTQVLANTDVDSTDSKLRFISTVDSLNYQKTGFVVYKKDAKRFAKPVTTNVYQNLYSVGLVDGEPTVKLEDMSKTFSNESKYYIASTMTGVNVADGRFEQEYLCRAYWVTLDGVEVRGNVKQTTIRDNLAQFYKNTIKFQTDDSGRVTGFVENDNKNWKRLATTGISGLTLEGDGWSVWPTGDSYDYNEFLLGRKIEVGNSANKRLEYTFTGKTGIAVISQMNNGLGRYAVKVVEVNNGQNGVTVGREKEVDLNTHKDNTRIDKVLTFTKTGLDTNKTYKLVVTGKSAQINVDALYLMP